MLSDELHDLRLSKLAAPMALALPTLLWSLVFGVMGVFVLVVVGGGVWAFFEQRRRREQALRQGHQHRSLTSMERRIAPGSIPLSMTPRVAPSPAPDLLPEGLPDRDEERL